MGLKKMKVSMIAERAEIATGTFYHFFESKEAYVTALIEEQGRGEQEQLATGLQSGGKLTLEQAIHYLRESFRKENNIQPSIGSNHWGNWILAVEML